MENQQNSEMNRRKFLFQLVMLTILLIVIIMGLQFLPSFSSSTGFSLFCIGFFFLLSLVMFFIAAKAAVSKDKYAFTRLIIVFTMLKMLLTVVLVVIYQKIAKPEGGTFLFPFFIIYIAYTVYETVFMTKLGKVKAR